MICFCIMPLYSAFQDAMPAYVIVLSRHRSVGSRILSLFSLQHFCLCDACVLPASDGEAVIDGVLSSEIEKLESGGKPYQLSQAIWECGL